MAIRVIKRPVVHVPYGNGQWAQALNRFDVRILSLRIVIVLDKWRQFMQRDRVKTPAAAGISSGISNHSTKQGLLPLDILILFGSVTDP